MSRQDRVHKDYTSNPIPTSFFFFQVQPFPVISYHSLGIHSTIMEKKRCRDGVTCVVLVYPVLPGIATTISSFCSFWHCHPYIPQHFLKMFLLLVIPCGGCFDPLHLMVQCRASAIGAAEAAYAAPVWAPNLQS